MIRMGGSHVEPHWTLTSAPRTRHQPTSRASTGGREGVGAQCVSGGAGGGERRQCLHCASCVHPFPPQKHQPPSPPGRRCCWSCAGRWRWGPQCPPGARGAGAASPPQAVSTAQQRQPAWRGACRAPVCVRVCVWGGVGWGASCSCCACRGQGCRRWAGSHTFRPWPPPPPRVAACALGRVPGGSARGWSPPQVAPAEQRPGGSAPAGCYHLLASCLQSSRGRCL